MCPFVLCHLMHPSNNTEQIKSFHGAVNPRLLLIAALMIYTVGKHEPP
ncbi:hypothetical protein CEAn_00425 [Coxiella endosymbiont of Amblyomma nuttalli]|nr:hypothetical protein CEAn_00425 [Coxiella endosymbiont of Amblyomma nuttalli]